MSDTSPVLVAENKTLKTRSIEKTWTLTMFCFRSTLFFFPFSKEIRLLCFIKYSVVYNHVGKSQTFTF